MRQLLLLGALSLAACGNGDAARQSVKDDETIRVAEQNVKSRLRDPSSAEFSNVTISRKRDIEVVCGMVNSRNGFGGMAGAKRFISKGETGGLAGFPEDFGPDEFDQMWLEHCL